MNTIRSENVARLLLDTWKAKRGGTQGIELRQRRRLAEIVSFARANSPYYAELYRHLPETVDNTTSLPVTEKQKLMKRFDECVTDRSVKLTDVRDFIENPAFIGEYFLGKYTVATTSGTTGSQGVFLIDDRTLKVTNALAVRMLAAWLNLPDVVRIMFRGGRMAMVNATGGHFASAIAAARLTRRHSGRVAVFSVQMPLSEMVAGLNKFRPALIAPYASMASILATEQEGRRLRINPVLLVLSAEGLPMNEYQRIGAAFSAKVRDSYAATECPFMSYRCEQGWLHVNSDWVILEAVDAEYQPVPPGQQSFTVLVTNLANRVQPILRYDLGDSIVLRADACPCGDKLPAIRVQGRSADVLKLPDGHGGMVAIAPLLVATIEDRVRGIERYQIVQTAPDELEARLQFAAGVDSIPASQTFVDELRKLLAAHGLGHIATHPSVRPPERSPGGKYRAVIPLRVHRDHHGEAAP